MRKRWIVLFVAIILMLQALSCSQESKISIVETTMDAHKLQIGMAFDTFVLERWQRDRDVFVSTAKKLNAEVNIQNANGDLEEQISQIRYFIDKKMDVIVIIAVDSYGLNEVVKEAKESGIKVVAYDRLIMNADVDLYISFDNEEVGRLMAESLIASLPKEGKMVMVNGPTRDYNVKMVESGFMSQIAQTNMAILERIYCDEWRNEAAFDYISSHYELVQRVDAIMCGNDGLAGMAIKGLSERRLAGEILVVGQDADLEACQRVVEGTQLMTVYKPIEKLAQEAAEISVLLANGESFIEDEQISDGEFLVPFIKIKPISVTKENMDQVIIEGGFHLKEDVYVNIPNQIK